MNEFRRFNCSEIAYCLVRNFSQDPAKNQTAVSESNGAEQDAKADQKDELDQNAEAVAAADSAPLPVVDVLITDAPAAADLSPVVDGGATTPLDGSAPDDSVNGEPLPASDPDQQPAPTPADAMEQDGSRDQTPDGDKPAVAWDGPAIGNGEKTAITVNGISGLIHDEDHNVGACSR